MGLYVLDAGTHPPKGKADTLVEMGALTVLGQPRSFAEVPSEMYAICVVDNGAWEAAGVAYDEYQFERFLAPDPNGRSKHWLFLPRETVEELNPIVKGAAESDAQDRAMMKGLRSG